jgi:LAO/AO transport system kinase
VASSEDDLAASVRSGDRRALARALTLAENEDPAVQAILNPSRGVLGRARRIGITGPPGAGKSTLVDALLREARGRKITVGVLAVDPTSPFTGGALLGDRIRMGDHALDDGVFIRSQASRGASGGLAGTTSDLLDLLDLAGFGLVLLETVGVGQSDLDGVRATDFAVVVLSPHVGDIVQAMKAGLIEAADLIVVNKSDLGGADVVRNDLLAAFELSSRGPREVLLCSARSREGVPEILDAVLKLPEPELAARRRAKLRERIDAAVARRLGNLRRSPRAVQALDDEAAKLGSGAASFHEAVSHVVAAAVGSGREQLP